MNRPCSTYLRKHNVGYEFKQSYKYDRIDGKLQAIGNKYEVVKTTCYGLTWREEVTEYATKEEGNEFYKQLLKDGFNKCDKSEYEKLRPWD